MPLNKTRRSEGFSSLHEESSSLQHEAVGCVHMHIAYRIAFVVIIGNRKTKLPVWDEAWTAPSHLRHREVRMATSSVVVGAVRFYPNLDEVVNLKIRTATI